MDKHHLIQQLKKCEAIKFGHFVLTSGIISDYYIDIKKASTNPSVLRQISQEMSVYTEGYDLLAGLELGAVPLTVALSLKTSIPYVIIRKSNREHGTAKQIEGENVKNKRILLIEDVVTSGGSVEKAIITLRRQGGIVEEVITVVDRESGAEDKLKDLGVTLIHLLSIRDILEKT